MKQARRTAADVVIIGGGIVGCSAAYFLAGRGARVVLLEKGVIGGEASGRNGGGVRAQCRDRFERPLAMASVKLWVEMQPDLGFETEYTQGGNIRLAVTEERMASLTREGEEELADGLMVEVWDRETLRRRAPYLADNFLGAKYCPTDGTANPLLATRAIGWAARRRGASLRTRTAAAAIDVRGGQVESVTAVDRDGELVIETPHVIHAAGAWSVPLARTIGVDLPVHPERNLIGVTQRRPRQFTEFLSSHDAGVYARQAREGHIHVGCIGSRPGFFDSQPGPLEIAPLARGVRLLPDLAGARYLRTWGGTLDMTPDRIPIIGPVDGIGGYFLAAGFSGHGFCIGPIVGRLLTEWLLDGAPSLSLDAFQYARFAALAHALP